MKLLLPSGVPYRQVYSFPIYIQFLVQERCLKHEAKYQDMFPNKTNRFINK